MKRQLKFLRALVADNWRVWLIILSGVAAVSFLLLFKLGSLVGGLSADEYALQQALHQGTLSIELILRNPVHLPYYLGLLIMQISPFHGPTGVRFVGALFGLLGAIGFYYILRKWYTLRMAVFGTALFATSSWFLHSARFANPEASYLLLPLLIAGMVYIQAKARKHTVLLLVTILGILTVYIPGLIWFLVPAIIIQRKTILKSLKLQPLWFKIAIGVTALIFLAPLLVMLIKPYGSLADNVLAILGLPQHFPAPLQIAKNIGHLVGNIFVYNVQGPLYVAGRLPLLEASTAALTVMGMYRFIVHFRLARTKLIAIVGIIGAVLIALGGPVSLVLLLPFVYLLAVEGIKWLLELWLEVFPRNPVARSFGVSLVVLVVLATSFYHLNRYYLAWGQSTETRAVFNKIP